MANGDDQQHGVDHRDPVGQVNFTTNASVQTLVQGAPAEVARLDLTITRPIRPPSPSRGRLRLCPDRQQRRDRRDVQRRRHRHPAQQCSFTSITTTSLFVCSPDELVTGVTVLYGRPGFNAGQNATIILHVTALATGPLTNTASVDPDNTIAESNCSPTPRPAG